MVQVMDMLDRKTARRTLESLCGRAHVGVDVPEKQACLKDMNRWSMSCLCSICKQEQTSALNTTHVNAGEVRLNIVGGRPISRLAGSNFCEFTKVDIKQEKDQS